MADELQNITNQLKLYIGSHTSPAVRKQFQALLQHPERAVYRMHNFGDDVSVIPSDELYELLQAAIDDLPSKKRH